MIRSSSLKRGFRAVTAVTVVAILFFVPVYSYAVRPHDTASLISPHSQIANAFFSGPDYLFAGGVVPRGQATFQTEDERQISPMDLEFVFKADKFGVKPDGDAIHIHWNSRAFTLPIPDRQIVPLLRFINADRTIAFTIPPVEPTAEYIKQSGLKDLLNGAYVARELADPALVDLLDFVDVEADTEPLDSKLERQILVSIFGKGRQDERIVALGSYVNADFHVTYKAYLVESQRGNYVDIAGLPLRYHWNVGSSKKAIVNAVETFSFPDDKDSLQYRAVMFFQNAAVFRQYKTSNPAGFDELLKAVKDVPTK